MRNLSELGTKVDEARSISAWEEAEVLCHRAISEYPGSCAPVLLLSGVLEEQGRLEEAVAHLQSNIVQFEADADLHFELARLLFVFERREVESGEVREPYTYRFPWGVFSFPQRSRFPKSRTPEIVDHLKQCLELELDHGRANCLLGALLLENEESIPEAAERIQRGVAQAPDWGAAHASMARLALRAGQYEVAVTASRAALENDECFDGVDGLCLVAEFLDGQRHDYEVALTWTEHQMVAVAEGLYLAKRNPSLTEEVATASAALSRSLADVLVDAAIIQIHECGAMVGAARLLHHAMLIYPDHPDAAVAFGALMHNIGEFEAAEANFLNAEKMGSEHALRPHLLNMARLSLGKNIEDVVATGSLNSLDCRKLALVYCREQSFEDAEKWLERAIEIDPSDASARMDLAQALSVQGRASEALSIGLEALAQRPDDPELRLGVVPLYMAAGEPGRAWPLYESRLDVFRATTPKRPPPLPRWDGEDLTGKRLLVWGEEGIGDEMLFASHLPDFMKRWPCDAIFECTPRLLSLLKRSLPGIDVRLEDPSGETSVDADYQLPSGSLALYVRQSLEAYAGSRKFLVAEPSRVEAWRRRLDDLGSGPKVGICWRSLNMSWMKRPMHSRLEDVVPLLGISGAHFINLQVGETAEELNRARDEFGATLHDFGDLDIKNDLDETTALIAALDSIVTPRGWVTCFAGLVGVQTYCFSAPPHTAVFGQRSPPWAPNVQVFMKNYGETWEKPLTAIASDIREQVANA